MSAVEYVALQDSRLKQQVQVAVRELASKRLVYSQLARTGQTDQERLIAQGRAAAYEDALESLTDAVLEKRR